VPFDGHPVHAAQFEPDPEGVDRNDTEVD